MGASFNQLISQAETLLPRFLESAESQEACAILRFLSGGLLYSLMVSWWFTRKPALWSEGVALNPEPGLWSEGVALNQPYGLKELP